MPWEPSDDEAIEAAKQPPAKPAGLSRAERLAAAETEEWGGGLVDVRDLLGGYLETAIGITGSDGVVRYLKLTLDASAFSGSTLKLFNRLQTLNNRENPEEVLAVAAQIMAPLIVDWPILDRATKKKMEITPENLAPLSIPFVMALVSGVIMEVTPDNTERDMDDPKASPVESSKASSKKLRSLPADASSQTSNSRGPRTRR